MQKSYRSFAVASVPFVCLAVCTHLQPYKYAHSQDGDCVLQLVGCATALNHFVQYTLYTTTRFPSPYPFSLSLSAIDTAPHSQPVEVALALKQSY